MFWEFSTSAFTKPLFPLLLADDGLIHLPTLGTRTSNAALEEGYDNGGWCYGAHLVICYFIEQVVCFCFWDFVLNAALCDPIFNDCIS